MKKTLKRGLSLILAVTVILGSAYAGISQINLGKAFAVESKAAGLSTPVLSKTENTATGVKLTWYKVSGATSYIVYRRTYNACTQKWSNWVNLAKGIKTNSYVDTAAKSGTYYFYTVRAANGAGATGAKTYFLSTPTLASVKNSSTGVTLKWNKVTGAQGYYVYRKAAGEASATKIATKKGNTSVTYNDTSVSNNTVYAYTVKAYYGTINSYVASSLSIRYLAAPTISALKDTGKSVNITWTKVAGAEGYYIYRADDINTSYKAIKKVTSGSTVTFADTSYTPGVKSTYKICAYNSGKTSAFSTAKSIRTINDSVLRNPLAAYQMAVKPIRNNAIAGYTRKSWQALKDDTLFTSSEDQKAAFIDLFKSFMTQKADAKPFICEKGADVTRWRMPISNCSAGDVKSATATKLSNGNYKIVIVMKDQVNPSYDDTYGLSLMSNIFFDYRDAYDEVENDFETRKTVKKINDLKVTYKAYTITATLTPDGRFVDIKHHCNATVLGDAETPTGQLDVSGTVVFDCEYYDFNY